MILSNQEEISIEVAVLFFGSLKDHLDSVFNEQLKFTLQQLDPLVLYKTLFVGIQQEYKILACEDSVAQSNPLYPIFVKIREIRLKVDRMHENLMRCAQAHVSFPNTPLPDINQFVVELDKVAGELETIVSIVINQKLREWQRSQALAGNGAPIPENLKDIQVAIERLLQLVRNVLDKAQIVIRFNFCAEQEMCLISRVCERLNSMREFIITSSFIVERQPPQVMKTNTRFAATARWLIGSEFCQEIPNTTSQVECYILSGNF